MAAVQLFWPHPLSWLAGVFALPLALCLFFRFRPVSSSCCRIRCLSSVYRADIFFIRGQDSVVRSILLEPPQGSVIHSNPTPRSSTSWAIRFGVTPFLDQIANVIEGKRFLSLSEALATRKQPGKISPE